VKLIALRSLLPLRAQLRHSSYLAMRVRPTARCARLGD